MCIYRLKLNVQLKGYFYTCSGILLFGIRFSSRLRGGGGGGGGTSECVQQSILCICTSNVLLDDKTTQSIVNDCYLSLLKVMIAIDENIRKDGKKKEHIISF